MSDIKNSVSNEEVLYQLSKVLSSPCFQRSRTLSSFLNFIVKEKLEGRVDSLKEYTIAVNALGQGKDYDPKDVAMVRIYAGRLRKLLTHYYSEYREEDIWLIRIPKGCYVPRFSTLQKAQEPALVYVMA